MQLQSYFPRTWLLLIEMKIDEARMSMKKLESIGTSPVYEVGFTYDDASGVYCSTVTTNSNFVDFQRYQVLSESGKWVHI